MWSAHRKIHQTVPLAYHREVKKSFISGLNEYMLVAFIFDICSFEILEDTGVDPPKEHQWAPAWPLIVLVNSKQISGWRTQQLVAPHPETSRPLRDVSKDPVWTSAQRSASSSRKCFVPNSSCPLCKALDGQEAAGEAGEKHIHGETWAFPIALFPRHKKHTWRDTSDKLQKFAGDTKIICLIWDADKSKQQCEYCGNHQLFRIHYLPGPKVDVKNRLCHKESPTDDTSHTSSGSSTWAFTLQ